MTKITDERLSDLIEDLLPKIQPPILVDEWWSPDDVFNGVTKPRRVLAEGNGYVMYSDGGRKPKECTKKAFEGWIKKYGCKLNRHKKP